MFRSYAIVFQMIKKIKCIIMTILTSSKKEAEGIAYVSPERLSMDTIHFLIFPVLENRGATKGGY